MNERLPEGKKTKQKPFLPGNQVHQRGGAPCEVSGSQHLRKPNQSIRFAHHVKKHFENTEKTFLVL